MAAMKVTEQIKNLVNSDNIDTKSAVVLLLAAHTELMETQNEIMDRLDDISELVVGQVKSIEDRVKEMEGRIEYLEEYKKDHPTLLWLMRFRTRETAVAIVVLFVLLSLWYVSGFRQPILDFLGMPVF